MELHPEQLIVISVLGSFLTALFRMIYEFAQKRKIMIPSWISLIIVAGISIVLSLLWFPQAFPQLPIPIGDPSVDLQLYSNFLLSVATWISSILGMAIVIYRALIIKVRQYFSQRLMPELYPPK
jgi:hypothetical protein